MAVTRVTTGGSASQIATGLNPTIAKSALSGLQDGDLLVASISQNGSTIGSGPSNWFSEGDQVSTSNPRLSVWTHYVSSVAAEPASWVWTLNSSVAYSIQVTVFRGHNIAANGATAFDGFGMANSAGATATAAVAPTFSTSIADTLLVGGAAGNSSSTTWTAGAGNTGTEIYDSGSSKSHCVYSDETFVGPGAVGTTTFTQSAARAWVAWEGAIAPAGVSGTSVDVPLGSLSLSGLTPTPTTAPAAPLGSLGFAGLIPALSATPVSAPLAAMAESGFVPAPKGQPSPPLGTENVVGFAPLAAMAVPLGSLTLAGSNPTPSVTSAAPLSNVSLSGLLPSPLAQPSPPRGSLGFAGLVPTTFAQQVVNVPLGSLGFAGLVPQPSLTAVSPLGSLTFAGLTPTAGRLIPLGSLALAGFIPVPTTSTINPLGSLAFTGFVPAPKTSTISPLGSLGFAGFIPGAATANPLGSLALAGFIPNPKTSTISPLGTWLETGLIPTFGSPLTSVSVPLGSLVLSGFLPSPKYGAAMPLGFVTISGFTPLAGRLIPLGSQQLNGLIPPAVAQAISALGNLAFSPYGPDSMATGVAGLGLWIALGFIPAIVPGGQFGIFGSGIPYLLALFESDEPFIFAGFAGSAELLGAFDSAKSRIIGEEI